MSHADPIYQTRVQVLETLQKGTTSRLSIAMYNSGAVVDPSAATVTVYDATGTALVDGAAATINAGVDVTYDVLAAVVAASAHGMGWRVVWSLTMPVGLRIIQREAALVVTRLYPPASWVDVFRREPGLDPSSASVIHAMTLAELDPFMDEAWVQIEARLLGQGKRHWLILDGAALREPLITGVLHLVYQSFATRLQAAYREIADMYRDQNERAWGNVRYSYMDGDSDTAGVSGGANPDRQGGFGSHWLGSVRTRRRV